MACVENGRLVERELSRHGPREPAILPTLLTAVLLLLVRSPEVPLAATVVVGPVLFAVALVSTMPGAPSWSIKLADGFAPTARHLVPPQAPGSLAHLSGYRPRSVTSTLPVYAHG
ncbi:MAG: hypothetical protein AVDCRST_MAG14-2356 [uncultured Rubrobacteraceae bacterium]|uniref:Uncharacterized protein n=1 Tax=uncultured Rubrobacteraceae bacterium TaxID=349277 RepID=A0A6J4RAZ2_9ACTN|nr:MAG: hypothetical protein AVDCRST_MAG14-2356 [uncultured Rubrobacteraceae bacterium]